METREILNILIAILFGALVGIWMVYQDPAEILAQERLLNEQYEADCYEIGGSYEFGECIHTLNWEMED